MSPLQCGVVVGNCERFLRLCRSCNCIWIPSSERFSKFLSDPRKKSKNVRDDPVKRAKEQFQVAAEARSDLGLRWLKGHEDVEKSRAQEAQ